MKLFDDVSMKCGISADEATADVLFPVSHGATDVRKEWVSPGHTRDRSIRESRAEAAVRQLMFFGRVLDLRADNHAVAWKESDGSFAVRFGERTSLGGMDAKAVVSIEDGELVIDVHLAVDAGYSRATDVAETKRFNNARDAATFVAGRHVVHRILTQE